MNVKPYVVKPSGKNLDEVISLCDKAHRGVAYEPAALEAYEELLDSLVSLSAVKFLTAHECVFGGMDRERRNIVFRHDVDSDIRTAVKLAKAEKLRGIRGSYYFLHTSKPYYGEFRDGVFFRNDAVSDCFLEIQNMGHEAGLHTNALGVYLDHGIDGSQSLEQELQWLRGQGLDITGTVAHNGADAYGANNFEIFRPRVRFHDAGGNEYRLADRPYAQRGGARAALWTLDERKLGLNYEATELFSLPGYSLFVAPKGNKTFWHTFHGDCPRSANTPQHGKAGMKEAVNMVDSIAPGRLIVFNVHPCYFGKRNND